MIVFRRRDVIRCSLMTVGVKDTNYLTINFNRVWNPDWTRQSVVDAFSDRRLSRARQAGQEQRPSGIDYTAECLQQ